MPKDGNRMYLAAEPVDKFSVPPAIITATANLTAFETGVFKELLADLNIHEFFETALAGANNDLVFIARTPGTTPTVRVTYTVAGLNTLLTVAVTAEDITVNVATDGAGVGTSTAAQVKAAVEAKATANALVVVLLASGNDGTGVVIALAQTALAGPTGTTPTLDLKFQASNNDGATYYDAGAFTQKTAASTDSRPVGPLGLTGRWNFTLTGTTPKFAYSIVGKSRI